MTEPEFAGLQPRVDGHHGAQGRRRVGHPGPQVVLQRHGRLGLRHLHGRHQPRRRSARAREHDHRAHGHARLRDDLQPVGHGPPRSATGPATPRSSTTDARVPLANILGTEGAGFVIAQQRLGPGRIHHCMRWIGICERALDLLCKHAVTREIAPGKPLGSKQIVQSVDRREPGRDQRREADGPARRLEDRDGRASTRRARTSRSSSSRSRAPCSGSSTAPSRALGGLGMTDDTPLAFWYAHERAARIYDGADEVHIETVAPSASCAGTAIKVGVTSTAAWPRPRTRGGPSRAARGTSRARASSAPRGPSRGRSTPTTPVGPPNSSRSPRMTPKRASSGSQTEVDVAKSAAGSSPRGRSSDRPVTSAARGSRSRWLSRPNRSTTVSCTSCVYVRWPA